MSKAKLITGSEKVLGLVDRGYEVDVEIKNLGFEDKGIKKMLAEELLEEFGDDTSIRVEGSSAAAVVTQSEKFTLDSKSADIVGVHAATERGLLGDAVKLEESLAVPADECQRASEILKAAGIEALVMTKMSVNPAEYRALNDRESVSAEEAQAKEALDRLVKKTVSHRVKYEKI
jgi:hypothetical protein